MRREKSSRLPGFYNLSPSERRKLLSEKTDLSEEQFEALGGKNGLDLQQADHMIENAIGTFDLPMGIAANFLINNKDYLIPMVIEEPSVVAGASFMAKLVRVRHI